MLDCPAGGAAAWLQMRLTEAGTDDAGIRLQRPEKYEPLPDDVSLMQVRAASPHPVQPSTPAPSWGSADLHRR